jgi:uncharacterized integral membrane protein
VTQDDFNRRWRPLVVTMLLAAILGALLGCFLLPELETP